MHKVKALQTSPLGRAGQVFEVDADSPYVDRWLTLGVLEYVEEVPGEGDGEDGPAGHRDVEPADGEDVDAQGGGDDGPPDEGEHHPEG